MVRGLRTTDREACHLKPGGSIRRAGSLVSLLLFLFAAAAGATFVYSKQPSVEIRWTQRDTACAWGTLKNITDHRLGKVSVVAYYDNEGADGGMVRHETSPMPLYVTDSKGRPHLLDELEPGQSGTFVLGLEPSLVSTFTVYSEDGRGQSSVGYRLLDSESK
jgi:hypothetical protein